MNTAQTQYALTLDVDWAPDWMIEEVCDLFEEHGVKATWFATHPSPAMDRILKNADLFEVGLHPNFFPGSSHGKTPEEVMTTLKEWFPEARSVRTHGLYSSERHLQMMAEQFGIKTDCSIFLKHEKQARPHRVRYSRGGSEITRLPHFFQDDSVILDEWSWDLNDLPLETPGLKIFNFHPIHIILNAPTPENYESLRGLAHMPDLTRDQVAPQICPPAQGGPGKLLRDLLQSVDSKSFQTIAEIAAS